jgi:hypothetical protein
MMLGWRFPKESLFAGILLGASAAVSHPALAWGDGGHEIIALVAEHYLDPAARAKVATLLAADTDALTDHDIASEATWADKYRDSDRYTTKIRYQATRLWHFVDIELAGPNLASACFGHPPLAPDVAASMGPPRACVVDKIDQFAAELGNPATPASERLLSLKFLLHLVGDLHQPLHAADDHDAGGNKKLATASGLHSGNLHRYWDMEFVERLGASCLWHVVGLGEGIREWSIERHVAAGVLLAALGILRGSLLLAASSGVRAACARIGYQFGYQFTYRSLQASLASPRGPC